MEIERMIPLAEYAALIGRHPDSVRNKCLRGMLPGAVKIGRNWLIPKDAPYEDLRVKSGKYVDWRGKRDKD